jgi:hypothetical protein
MSFHRHAAAVHRELGDRWRLALSLSHLSTALREFGATEESQRHNREALTALADFDDFRANNLRAHLRGQPPWIVITRLVAEQRPRPPAGWSRGLDESYFMAAPGVDGAERHR